MSVTRTINFPARPRMLSLLLALTPLTAVAHTGAGGPNDPQASVPSVAYTSALSQYQAAPAGQPTPDKGWSETNEAVRVSAMPMGHMAHSPATPAAAAKPASTQAADHSQMDHSKMDHSKMDHSKMNHGQEGH